MARKPKPPAGKSVEALRHEEATRRNIPTAEYQSVIQKEAEQPAELSVSLLDDEVKIVRDRVPVGTMHLSKGLEFRAVASRKCTTRNVISCTSRVLGRATTCW